MFFGARLNSLFEPTSSWDEALLQYEAGARLDLSKLETFLRSVWAQDIWKNDLGSSLAGIELDPYDYEIRASISRSGVVTISIGLVLALDGIASMLAVSHEGRWVEPDPEFSHLNERFPLFSDYSFLNRMKITPASPDSRVLLVLIPELPDTEKGFLYWRLAANLMLAYTVLHEVGHARLGHHEEDQEGPLRRILELEADTYAVTRLFLDFYLEAFQRAASEAVSHAGSLFQLLVTASLTMHSVLQARAYSDVSRVRPLPVNYPGEAARLVNALTSIHNGVRSCSGMNQMTRSGLYPDLGPRVETYLVGKALVVVDEALRLGGRAAVLTRRGIAELVFDPTRQVHSRFVAGRPTEAALMASSKEMLKMWWLWSNMVRPPQSILHYARAFDEWKSTILEAEDHRGALWREKARADAANMEADSAAVSTCRFFAANCDSARYAETSGVTDAILWDQATQLVESVYRQAYGGSEQPAAEP